MLRSITRPALVALLGLVAWLAGEQPALAQVILAQSGMAKTAIGWVLVALALLLALLVVGRPSGRRMSEGDERRR
ncbi:MAG: hypothetical protein WD872_11350 [Pirellulaceae bacterium]